MPANLDGSMMPYDFRNVPAYVYMPDSLKPVTALYVARHGARYLSGPKKTDAVMKHLIKARNAGLLSDTGEDFLQLMEQITDTNTGNWGDLSAVGIKEQKLLGERMARVFKPLASPGARVAAISSHVPRVVMTMYEFSHALVRANDRMTTSTAEGPLFDPLLCCFMADSAYAAYRDHGDWRRIYDGYVASHVPTAPARRLFTTTNLSDEKLRRLTIDMYEVLKANRAYGLPAPTTRWMSEADFRACWRADNLRHYLRNSITPWSDLAAKATSPLLVRMTEDADKALAAYADPQANVNRESGQGEPSRITLNAYFGHCETLLPLLSLIGIPDMPGTVDPDNLDDYWKIEELSPLGANLVIILAEAPSGMIYAAMQLNGRTIRPLKGYPEILPWQTLKSGWQRRLRAFDAE